MCAEDGVLTREDDTKHNPQHQQPAREVRGCHDNIDEDDDDEKNDDVNSHYTNNAPGASSTDFLPAEICKSVNIALIIYSPPHAKTIFLHFDPLVTTLYFLLAIISCIGVPLLYAVFLTF